MRKQRTSQQNKAFWKFCELLAEDLNSHNLDMKVVLKPEVEIPWSKDMVHDFLWIPIQKAMTGTDSTTEMNTQDCSQIHEVLMKHLVEKFADHGLDFIPWPSEEDYYK